MKSTLSKILCSAFLLAAMFVNTNASGGVDPNPNPDPTLTTCEDEAVTCPNNGTVVDAELWGIACFTSSPCCIRKTYRYHCSGDLDTWLYADHYYTSNVPATCEIYVENNEAHARCVDANGNPVQIVPAPIVPNNQ